MGTLALHGRSELADVQGECTKQVGRRARLVTRVRFEGCPQTFCFSSGDRLSPHTMSQRVQPLWAGTAPVRPILKRPFDAQSQRVRPPGASTAPVLPLLHGPSTATALPHLAALVPKFGTPVMVPPSPRCPSPDNEPPSLLKRRISGESSKRAEEQWQLYPRNLREERYSGAVVPHMTWGRQEEPTKHLFTVFDTRRHLSTVLCHDATRVADFARIAVDSAPGPVRALQFLTVPIPGLPLPQVVLTLVADPADAMAIPWDCRAVGLPVRTVPHLPNELLRHAAASLQHTVPSDPDLAARINDGRLLVIDVAGLLQDALPLFLTELQWLRVEKPIWGDAVSESHLRLPSMFASLRLGLPAGIGGLASTTSTTTGMMQPANRIFRVRLFGDGKEVSHEVQAPCPQLDLVLCLLLGKLQHTQPSSCGPSYVMMAKAQPPPEGDVQEILFLSHPADAFDTVPVFVDGRPQGNTLVLTALHRITTTEQAIPDNLRNSGCFALVNGAPAHLAQRSVMPGDYVQLGCSGVFVPHTAATDIMNQLPSSDVYGYAFAAQRRADDGTFLQRIRERRRAAQVWQPLENLITIVGPAHGPVRLRMETLLVPTVEEVRAALIPMTDFNGMRLAMAHTTAQIPGAALFATVCPQSDLRTVLLPLATSPTHYIVLMVPSLAEDLGYLPLDPQQRILWTYGRWRHGQILAIFTLPASMARPVHRHVRPPRTSTRETYSPGGRVVPRSGCRSPVFLGEPRTDASGLLACGGSMNHSHVSMACLMKCIAASRRSLFRLAPELSTVSSRRLLVSPPPRWLRLDLRPSLLVFRRPLAVVLFLHGRRQSSMWMELPVLGMFRQRLPLMGHLSGRSFPCVMCWGMHVLLRRRPCTFLCHLSCLNVSLAFSR